MSRKRIRSNTLIIGLPLVLVVWLSTTVCARSVSAQVVNPTTQQLDAEIKNLEKRQQIVVESMEKTYSYGLWFIGIAVSITTLLSAIRYVQDQRLLKDAQDLGKSYKINIDTTNALMTSIKGALEFYMSAEEIRNDVKRLEDLQTKTEHHMESQMKVLNDTAMELSPKCKRTAHNDPTIQRLVRDFHDQYEILDRSSQTEELLNANGHFVLGFHHRIESNYEEALKEFTYAQDAAVIDMGQPDHPAYRKLPQGITLSTWLTKLINICAYHRAIIHNNLGEYEIAKPLFETALSYDPLDYQSLAYIPETMFLGGLASFSQVVAKFRTAISTVETLTAAQEQKGAFTLDKAKLLGLLYLKLGNCYMAESQNPDYVSHRNPTEAERLMRAALQHDPASTFARLSLAQLLVQSRRDAKQQRELFVEVFASAKAVVSRVTEPKILMMYYYTMLICCTLGEIAGEAPGVYVIRILELIPKLPKPLAQKFEGEENRRLPELRIFSPYTKTDLKVPEFTSEVQGFVTSRSSAATQTERLELSIPQGIAARPKALSVGRSLLEDE